LDLEAIFQDRLNGVYPEQAMREHLPYLRDTVVRLNAQTVIELGVHTGQSTVAFLTGLVETGGRLWSCDVAWPKPPVDTLFETFPDTATFVLGDSQSVSQYAPSSVDLLLVDAALENRFQDLMTYGHLVKPGGVILVHDTERVEVRQAIAAYLQDRPCKNFTHIDYGHGLAVIEV